MSGSQIETNHKSSRALVFENSETFNPLGLFDVSRNIWMGNKGENPTATVQRLCLHGRAVV